MFSSNSSLRTIRLCGRVFSGLGEGSRYVGIYSGVFRKHLGINPYPGTLNIDFGFNTRDVLPLDRAIVIQPPVNTLNPIYVFKGLINREINVFVLKPWRTRYSWRVLEVICEYSLREKLGLRDGDFLEIVIMV